MTSLKRRLILAATLWITFGMISAGFVLSGVFKRHVTDQTYIEIYEHLDEFVHLTEFKPGTAPHLTHDLSDPRYDIPMSGYYWEIQKAGSVLAKSGSLEDAVLLMPPDFPTDVGTHTAKSVGPTGTVLIAARTVRTPPDGSPIRFVVGTDQRYVDAAVSRFHSILSWALTGFGLSMVVGAVLLILYALKPLNTLRSSLADVRTGASRKLEGTYPLEVLPLVNDLNSLLVSTSELIQRARTQAGNLAHGLKTPLAVLTDEAYRIEECGLPQSSATILTQCRKMQTQIDYQISRARAVALRSIPGTVAEVRKAAEEVANALRRLYGGSGVAITVDVSDGLLVACDPQDLNEMLANVVDNACKHAKSHVRISCHGLTSDKTFDLHVEDDGKGLPPEAFEVVFDVGERWDSREAGSGLGLAIVQDLARLYGGDVRLQKSSMGGLWVVLTLPSASDMANDVAEA
ncbi:integral membrane sensor signal transduction histidine kinase [Hyphomicrobium denitrificans 1NES1]|uniref:histidine kinase n=1 Tax=Hyphomicrobium denitrificans 1NES1 TaxID=670307 RepID=N0B742_9HYPH|nr:HAMP domain-containing sensor histidine kinase [Hyphomicrobium denitrificans]AGK56366.1 integral membrane sensor signal transduction histidine kinase [Hyphomicrobium denitrificans 1NES1]